MSGQGGRGMRYRGGAARRVGQVVLMLVSAAVGVAAAGSVPADAATACSVAGRTLTVRLDGGTTALSLRSKAIRVGGVHCSGSPTTTTIDRILVSGSAEADTLVFSLAGGAFA